MNGEKKITAQGFGESNQVRENECTQQFYLDIHAARLAQSVEHETLNLGVVGSSPTLGDSIFHQLQS